MKEVGIIKKQKKVPGKGKYFCSCGCGGDTAEQDWGYADARNDDGPEYCACSCGPMVDRDTLVDGSQES